MKKTLLITLFASFAPQLFAAVEAPNVHLTLELVTPDGNPVTGIKCGVAGGLSTPVGRYPRNTNDLTDSRGRFSAVIGSVFGEVSAFADGPTFYRTEAHGIKLFASGEEIQAARKTGHWQDLTIKLVHKPVKNPVPMYVLHINGDIPETNSWVGFDLQQGDWVVPHGKGTRADFEFFANGVVQDFRHNYHGSLLLRLPGEGNGIQAYDYTTNDIYSALKMPYRAPTNGYAALWTWTNACITPPGAYAHSKYIDESYPNRGFMFRVRSVVDAEGRIIQANYGKIEGPFIFSPRGRKGRCHAGFTYFFNPDGTPNLEFDLKRNLFPNLK